jgi:hypothetical protein
VKLVVDEDLASHSLIKALRARSHDVQILPTGLLDSELWESAQETRSTVLTGNTRDFVPFAKSTAVHSGLLLVVRHRERTKDLTSEEIAEAVDKLDRMHSDLTGLTLVVNGFVGADNET